MTTPALTFENFNALDFNALRSLKHSSDSLVENPDWLIDIEQERIISQKFLRLENMIGKELIEKLSHQDKIFMIETANSIDFGHAVDLEKISEAIKNYEIS